jgi:hypothetical protein
VKSRNLKSYDSRKHPKGGMGLFIAICGFAGIVIGVVINSNGMIIIGAGAIGMDLVAELSHLNQNFSMSKRTKVNTAKVIKKWLKQEG